MMKWMLAAGAAALAIASPALSDPKGQKGGKGGATKEHAGHAMKAKGGGGDKQSSRSTINERGKDRVQIKAAKNDDPGRGRGRDAVKSDDRGGDKVRSVKIDEDKVKVRGNGSRGDKVRVVRFDDDDVDVRFAPRWDNRGVRLGFVDGCPPGLAKKGTGCLPPGQARKIVGTPFSHALGLSTLSGPYREWYRDDDRFLYRWDDDGFVYRVRRDNSLIDALFPITNRDFYYYPVGLQYPDYYNYYNVPLQYQSFYPDGGASWYRYGDGAIYMVDPQTRTIQGIAALLTGAPLAVGQPLPPTYGVYNVPLGMRSSYYDTPDAWYRYNDGYIYRVDPATQLITAVISALV